MEITYEESYFGRGQYYCVYKIQNADMLSQPTKFII